MYNFAVYYYVVVGLLFLCIYMFAEPIHLKEYLTVNNNKIPKIIIQTWKTAKIPNSYQAEVNSVKQINPDFKYMFFSDADIHAFFKEHYPNYLSTYMKLPIIIQKIDFFRYVAVYHYGGFYFDLDMTAIQNIDDSVLDNQCVFPIDEFISPEMCNDVRYSYFCKKGLSYLLGQYAFGAVPKHPFILFLINDIHANIDNYIDTYNKLTTKKNDNYVYSTTGPDFVTKKYLEYTNQQEITILPANQRQYFGEYARHNYKGTWK